jgi:PAS domain S-box-containing protein
MNLLDIRTLMVSHVATDMISALVIAILWWQNRRRLAGTGWWAVDFVCQATASLLIVLRGAIPDWLSIAGANTLVVAGTLAALVGLEHFAGKPGAHRLNLIYLVIFAGIHTYFTTIRPDLTARNLNISVGLLIMAGQCVWLVWRRVQPDQRRLMSNVGAVFGLLCLISLVRIIVTQVGPQPNNDFFKSGTLDALVLLAFQVTLISLVYSLVLMVNRRLLGDVQTQEEKFAAAFHSAPYAITLTRLADGRILEVNDGFMELTGYTRPDVLGHTTLDLHLWVREEDRTTVVNALARDRQVQGLEFPFRTKSGALLTGFFSAKVIPLNGEEWILSSISDITERKQAEEALAEKNRLFKLNAEIGEIINRAETLAVILRQCAEAVVGELDIALARFWLLNEREDVLELRASAGRYTHLDGPHSRIPVGQSKVGQIAATGAPHLTNMVRDDPAISDPAWAQREGIVAFAGYPLIVEARVVGVMALFAHHPLTDFSMNTLRTTADKIALGIVHKQAEEALRRQNTYLAALQATSLDLVSQLDLDTLLHKIVQRASDLLGATAGYLDLVEAQTGLLTPRVATGALTESLRHAAQPGEGVAGIVWQTGQALIVEDYDDWPGRVANFSRDVIHAVIGVPLVAAGRVTGVLGLAHDAAAQRTFEADAVELLSEFARLATLAIENARLFSAAQQELAERTRAEENLQRSAAELARSNKELEQFAYVASHDLQEPLRMVASFVGLLKERYQGQLDADADEFIGFAVDGAQRMQRLISDLLAYSRVGTRELTLRPTDSAEALDLALDNLQVAIAESQATVTHDPLPIVLADGGQLIQLFQNLIGNALKFRGSAPPIVHVSARETFEVSETSKVWEFSVRDNGIGIAAHDAERVFVIFERLHSRQEYPGTGIGLAVCKRIVERHGGRIWVASQPGQGSTFSFTLPGQKQQTSNSLPDKLT